MLALLNNASSMPIEFQPMPAHAEARVQQLSKQLIDTLFDIRSSVEQQKADTSVLNRAKDDEDDDDTTAKLVNKAANALRPIIKELASVVNTTLPAGPARQLVKATANAVDSLLPLILKYALGI
ncbi:hypothetical protein EDC05_002606 [Coemansia umbellata]|nr:hypothetical protein EDC05_002606 [Coemansia umbellata]